MNGRKNIRRKVLLCLLVYILLGYSPGSQTIALVSPDATYVDINWEKMYGGMEDEWGKSLSPTSDGGYIILGITTSFGEGQEDILLIKVDSEGVQEWNATFGGAEDDAGFSVVETKDNGFAILGHTDSFSDNKDFWIVKVDNQGNELWNQTYGGAQNEILRSGILTTDGGLALTGGTFSFGPDQDVWLLKVNGSGSEQWNATFGGSGAQRGLSIIETQDSGLAVSLGYGIWKTNNMGIPQWNNTFGTPRRDFFNNIIQTVDGGFVVSGGSDLHGSAGNNDFVIARVSVSGSFEWIVTHGGQEWDNSCCSKALVETDDGSLLMTGVTESFGDLDGDLWLLKTTANGVELWNEVIGGINQDRGESMLLKDDGSIVIIGSSDDQSYGDFNIWLLNLNEKTDITPSSTQTSMLSSNTADNFLRFELLTSIASILVLNVLYWKSKKPKKISAY